MNFLVSQGFANIVSVITLCVLGWYAYLTNLLARSSMSQSATASEALENASRPCVLVMNERRDGVGDIGIHPKLGLENIGNGPALNISWRFHSSNSARLANSLAAGELLDLEMDTKEFINGEGIVYCEFKSLSGVVYTSQAKLVENIGSFHIEHEFARKD